MKATAWLTRRSISAASKPARRRPKATFSHTVSHGKPACSWKAMPTPSGTSPSTSLPTKTIRSAFLELRRRDARRHMLDPQHAQHFEIATLVADHDPVIGCRQLHEFEIAAPARLAVGDLDDAGAWHGHSSAQPAQVGGQITVVD